MSRTGDALRRAGLKVVSDSPVAGRPYSFGPIKGVMDHHTVSTASDANQIAMLKRGRSDLPGPLCQVYVCWQTVGGVAVISEGRANHAGSGGYSGIPTSDGNRWFRGIEVGASGATPIQGHQLETLIKVNAALLEMDGLAWDDVIGHKEWTSRKIDIRNNMATVRSLTRTVMAGPVTPPPPPPTPPPTPPEDEVTPEDRAIIVRDVVAALEPSITAAAENAAIAAVASVKGTQAVRGDIATLSNDGGAAVRDLHHDVEVALAILGTDYDYADESTYASITTTYPTYGNWTTEPNPALTCGGEGTDHQHNLDITYVVNTTTGGVA